MTSQRLKFDQSICKKGASQIVAGWWGHQPGRPQWAVVPTAHNYICQATIWDAPCKNIIHFDKKLKTKFVTNTTDMKGVNYVTDGSNKKVAVQIDLKLLEKYDEEIEDLIDGIIAESRKDEERKPLNEVIKSLKNKGKLK